MRNIAKWIPAFAVWAICAAPAAAQDGPTLKKISTSRIITLGVREASHPFSFTDDGKQYTGYSVDLCLKIVDAIKTTLKLPDLKVNFVKVIPAARVQMVMNNEVDLECGSTTNSVERQKTVSFVVTTFFTGTKLLVKTASGIKDFKDLKGKPVVVTRGTTNERAIRDYNLQESMNMSFVDVRDHHEALAALENGSAVAFPMDDVLLYSMRANAKNPAEYSVVGDFMTDEPYGIMLRKDDPAFKKLADNAVIALFKSGEINKIYARWFESPLPPKKMNLNMPMNNTLKKLIRSPNDKGVDKCGRMECMLSQVRDM